MEQPEAPRRLTDEEFAVEMRFSRVFYRRRLAERFARDITTAHVQRGQRIEDMYAEGALATWVVDLARQITGQLAQLEEGELRHGRPTH